MVQYVGIKGHAVAEAVAEAPKGVARALLYIVRASPSFLLHPSYKSFYHTVYHNINRVISFLSILSTIYTSSGHPTSFSRHFGFHEKSMTEQRINQYSFMTKRESTCLLSSSSRPMQVEDE